MRCRVRREPEPPLLPAPDRVPIEMRQPVPRVAHIPRVQSPDVVRDEERGGGESHVGEYRIDVLAEGRITVVKSQEKFGMRSAACGMLVPESLGEPVQCEGLPTCPGQRRHLTCEGGPRDTPDPKLQRAPNPMVAQQRRETCGRALPHPSRGPGSPL